MDSQTQNDESVRRVPIRFTTRHSDLAVADTPILIPTSLRRYGLSEVVNHLLAREKAVPFDFLVDGQLLRTSLDEYLVARGLSTESQLSVEYIRALLPPQTIAATPQPDWISALSIRRGDVPLVACSRFDGGVSVLDRRGSPIAEHAALHGSVVKTVAWLDGSTLLSAGMDTAVRLHKFSETAPGLDTATPIVFYGHEASVEHVLPLHDSTRFLSCGMDGRVLLWSPESEPIAPPTGALMQQQASRTRKKRQRRDDGDADARGPVAQLQGHVGAGAMQACQHSDPTVAYTVGMDYTVRTWDLVTGGLVDTKTLPTPLMSVARLPALNTLVIGSTNGHLYLHDPRAAQTVHSNMRGHTNMVVALAAGPEGTGHSQHFVSGSYDGTCRIWDVRSPGAAVYSIPREKKGRVYAADWAENVGIVHGGESNVVQIEALVQ